MSARTRQNVPALTLAVLGVSAFGTLLVGCSVERPTRADPYYAVPRPSAASDPVPVTDLLAATGREAEPAKPVASAVTSKDGPPEKGQGIELKLPVFLGNQKTGDIESILAPDGSGAWFNAEQLETILGELIPSSDIPNLTGNAIDGYVTVEDIELEEGSNVQFDQSSISLVFDIPLEARLPQPVQLTAEGLGIPDNLREKAAKVSAYVNLTARQSILLEDAEAGDEFDPDPSSLGFDGAIRIGGSEGFTIEGSGLLTEDRESGRPYTFQRGPVRVVYDHLPTAVRVSVGDVSTAGASLQSPRQIGGLSIEREYDLRPEERLGPAGQTDIVIDRAATVSVEVNGRQLDEFRLSPGSYDFRDFPIRSGPNEIVLRIEDDLGVERIIILSPFLVSSLLAPGQVEFSYGAGFEQDTDEEDSFYNLERPVVSGAQRVGVTDYLTLGTFGQWQIDGYVTGAEGTVSTPIGALEIEFATNDATRFHREDVAASLIFQTEFPGTFTDDNSTLEIAVAYEGEDFESNGVRENDVTGRTLFNPDGSLVDVDEDLVAPFADADVIANARFTTDINEDLSMTLGGSYAHGRGDAEDEYAGEIAMDWSPASEWSLRIAVGHERLVDDKDGFYGTVSVSYRFPEGDRLKTGADSRIDEAFVDFTHSADERVGAVGYGLSVTGSDEEKVAEAEVEYFGNRGTLRGELTSQIQRNDTDTRVQTGTITAATALVYADDHIAFSQPVSDSFVIVHGHPTLQGRKISIEPSEDGAVAESSLFGPAVAADITSNTRSTVEFEVEDLPFDYEIGDPEVQLALPFRGGAVHQVGSAGTVSVIGVLVGPDGAPRPLAVGEAVAEEDPDAEPQIVFSNGSGRFALQSLQAGKYVITLKSPQPGRAEFTIDESQTGIVQLGDVEVE